MPLSGVWRADTPEPLLFSVLNTSPLERLARRERSVVLAVEDDGRGFSRAQSPGDGFGLVGMRERVASVNGAVEIESRRGAGTRLTVEIPVPDGAQKEATASFRSS